MADERGQRARADARVARRRSRRRAAGGCCRAGGAPRGGGGGGDELGGEGGGEGVEGRGRSGWSERSDTESVMRAGRDGWARKKWRETPVTCERRRRAGGRLVAGAASRRRATRNKGGKRGLRVAASSCGIEGGGDQPTCWSRHAVAKCLSLLQHANANGRWIGKERRRIGSLGEGEVGRQKSQAARYTHIVCDSVGKIVSQIVEVYIHGLKVYIHLSIRAFEILLPKQPL
jgi:hypothetical protein